MNHCVDCKYFRLEITHDGMFSHSYYCTHPIFDGEIMDILYPRLTEGLCGNEGKMFQPEEQK